MKKVLVVDDSETLLSSLKQKFDEHENIEVIYAKSYNEAMKIIRKEHKYISVALLDINLRDAPDGQIISLAKSNNIPTIVLPGTLNKKD